MDQSSKKITSLFFIVSGILLLVINLAIANLTLKFIRKAATAKGFVVGAKYGRFHPEIKFITANNETFIYTQGGFNKGYRMHDTMEVLYDPGNPKDSSTEDFGALWGMHIAFLAMGLALVVTGGIKLAYPNMEWLYFNFEKQD